MQDLKNKLPELRGQLKSKDEFEKIYKFTFTFLKGEEARNVKIDYAIPMWELLLKQYYGEKIEPFLQRWTLFLQDQKNNQGLNGIKKDEWNSLLDLFKDKGIALDKMVQDDADCWPLLFDSFLESLAS